ncbi:hypothetical protein ACWDFH_23970 [Streptomyces kronopolitis]
MLESRAVSANPRNSYTRHGSMARASEVEEFEVAFRVRAGRALAFELVVTGTKRSLGDMWPLRREIAKHAEVSPDRVHPQWHLDASRIELGRWAPAEWLVESPVPRKAPTETERERAE